MGEVAYLFGGAGHDRTCDHPVYSWVDPSTSLKPFANNPILGGGAAAAYGASQALPRGGYAAPLSILDAPSIAMGHPSGRYPSGPAFGIS